MTQQEIDERIRRILPWGERTHRNCLTKRECEVLNSECSTIILATALAGARKDTPRHAAIRNRLIEVRRLQAATPNAKESA